jgi:hypothetical protein
LQTIAEHLNGHALHAAEPAHNLSAKRVDDEVLERGILRSLASSGVGGSIALAPENSSADAADGHGVL